MALVGTEHHHRQGTTETMVEFAATDPVGSQDEEAGVVEQTARLEFRPQGSPLQGL
jgi:hypothetical protein